MEFILKNDRVIRIREACPDDAGMVLAHIERVSGESQYLTFGPGEFTMTEADEADFFRTCAESPNQVYALAFLDSVLVATGNIMASSRPRLRHRGELAMSVSRDVWGLGIGGAMLDYLIAWSQNNPMLSKLDLRVRTDHVRGVALYRSRLFEEEGTLNRQLCVDGSFYDVFHMGLAV